MRGAEGTRWQQERKVKRKKKEGGSGGGEKSVGVRGKAGREVLPLPPPPGRLLPKPPDSWERQTADFPPREPGNAAVEPRVRGGGGGGGGREEGEEGGV